MALQKTNWNSIVDLVSTGQNVSDSLDIAFNNIDDAIDQIDINAEETALNTANIEDTTARVEFIENGGNSLEFTGTSAAGNQSPTGLDTPLQVEFGIAQTGVNGFADLASDGTVTFNVSGRYNIGLLFNFGRIGGAGESELYGRRLIDGVQIGPSMHARLDDADVVLPFTNHFDLDVTAGQTFNFEMIRDSSGNDSGGLYSATPNAAGWNTSPCAMITVKKHP